MRLMSTRRFLVGAGSAGVLALLVALSVMLWWRSARPSPPPGPPSPVDVPSVSEEPLAPPPEDRTPEIRGRVLDTEGNAAAGATVRLVSTTPPYGAYREVKSDAAGGFSFANVTPGSLRVVADEGEAGVVTSAVLHLAAGQTEELTLVLAAAGFVRGAVVDAEGHPVAGAAVSVENLPWTVSATSDPAGAFRLVAVPDEATALVAVARGFRTAHATLAVAGEEPERVVHIVMAAASPVDGEVQDDEGNPVAADVVACEGQPSETRAQSKADGTFQLAPSAIGCDAVAEHAELASSDAVAVVEGKSIVLRLKAGGSIEGVVVDERGSGVSPFTVGIESFVPARGRPHPGAGARLFDDLRGAFRWDRLAPGSYVLTASTPGRPAVRSSPIDVRAGAVSSGVRIVLPQGGTLVGHVYGPDGAVSGVRLRFDAVSSVLESKSSAVSDDTGEYRLDEAPAGPFTLRAEKDGLRTKLVSGLYVSPGATVRQDVTLSARDGNTALELGGIGAGLVQTPAGLAVRKLFSGDPAAVAGLREGDLLVRVDGEPVEGMSMADVLARVRGEPGTTVGIAVQRPETGAIVETVIVRAKVVH
jgi:hypothetical protein